MSSALDAFREQREAVEQLHTRLAEVATLVRTIQVQVDAVSRNQAFRDVLRDEHDWLNRADRVIADVRAFREEEMRRFWPAVWRRWVVAVAFALAAAFALGSGYVWASRPYHAELDSLRARSEFMDAIAQRVLTMTPAERRQFDMLMKWNAPPKR